MKRTSLFFIFLAVFSLPTMASEQDTKPTLLLEVERAKPIERPTPRYPKMAGARQQEGWVDLSYVIDKNGSVIDPIVTDSSGEGSFEKSALNAIEKWKFTPAMQNGEPIQQCDMNVRLQFVLQSDEKSVRRRFKNSYEKVDEAIKTGDIVLAREAYENMKSQKIWNRTENAWFWLLSSRIEAKADNKFAELRSLYRANDGIELDYLGAANYNYNLYRIFILELQSRQFLSAYKSFETLKTRENAQRYINELSGYFDKVEALLNSDEPLAQRLEISERGTKVHNLFHNSFSVSDINGELDMLDIRCQNKRSKFTVETDSLWKIPKSWGKCSVLFEGDEGTTFDVLEVKESA